MAEITRIKQILKAEGTDALYADSDGSIIRTKVIIWALVCSQERGEPDFEYVTGMDLYCGDISRCEENYNFLCYKEDNKEIDEYDKQAAKDFFVRDQKRRAGK